MMLLAGAALSAAMLQPLGIPSRPMSLRQLSVACQQQDELAPGPELAAVVAQQAAEIAALRSMVEELQNERQDQQLASGMSPPEGAVLLLPPTRDQPAPPPPTPSPPKRDGLGPKSSAPWYALDGRLPPDFDASPIERLIERRVVARSKRRYSEADRLQKRILRMGVCLDDRRQMWSLRRDWKQRHEALQQEDEQNGRQEQLLKHELESRIRFLFRYWDEDGNGLIDRSEFRLAMQILARSNSEIDYDAAFDRWDADGNGGLNFKEVRLALLELQQENPQLLEDAHLTASILSEERGAIHLSP